MQKARSHPATKSLWKTPNAGAKAIYWRGSYSLPAHDFRFYFTPLPGFFSPFPRGTCSLSVTGEYLALEGGPPRFRRRFTGTVLLGNTPGSIPDFRLRDYHPLRRRFPASSANPAKKDPVCACPTTPRRKRRGLGSSASVRHYSRNLV